METLPCTSVLLPKGDYPNEGVPPKEDPKHTILSELAAEDSTSIVLWVDALSFDIVWYSESFAATFKNWLGMGSDCFLDWVVNDSAFLEIVETSANNWVHGVSQDDTISQVELTLRQPGCLAYLQLPFLLRVLRRGFPVLFYALLMMLRTVVSTERYT